MPKRGRFGRFVKSVRRGSRRVAKRARASAAGVRGFFGSQRGLLRGGRGVLGHPVSRMVAPTLAVGAELALTTRPLSNGDNWVSRVKSGVDLAQQTKNPIDVLAIDSDGNNVLSIASYQIEHNAGSALVLAFESAVLGKVGRWSGT